MLQIVNDYYESCGDAESIRFSDLEKYAVLCGFDIKAYDFRRNMEVRQRLDELRDLSLLPMETGSLAYKSLDVDALINKARSKEALKNSLVELDKTWHRIYNRAVSLSKKNETLSKTIQQQVLKIESLEIDVLTLSNETRKLKKELKDMLLEKRYLKKMIKVHLYPALANEILKNENVLEEIDTQASPESVQALSEAVIPVSFSKATATDRAILSREESLLSNMWEQISGGQDG